MDTISKRARTKIVNAKSGSAIKSSEREKISKIFGTSIIAKKRSSKKGKSVLIHGVQSSEEKPASSQIDMSCSAKSGHIVDGASLDGISSSVNVEDEKKPEESVEDEKKPVNSPMDSNTDKMSGSPAKEASPHSKVAMSEAADEASAECASLDVKPSLSCNNEPQGNTVVLAISATTESRKRKHKAKNDKSQKKSRTDKGKCVVNASKQRGSKAKTATPGSSKSRRKHKSVNCGVSVSWSKEDIGKKKSDVQGKEEVSINFIFCMNYS